MKQLYEGKAKIVYEHNDDEVIFKYKDSVTAFNNVKKDNIKSKGLLICNISSLLFEYLEQNNIKTHFIKQISDTEQLCQKVDIIPLEVIVRNSAGPHSSIVKKFNVKPNVIFPIPVVEFSYKDDNLGDPLISEGQIISFGILSEKNLNHLKEEALKINKLLQELFATTKIFLVDFKLEFGKTKENKIILADEISPDTMRLQDLFDTNKIYDKDLFRHDKGDLIAGYEEFYNKLKKLVY